MLKKIKQWTKDHKTEVIVGAAVVGIGIASVIILKQHGEIKILRADKNILEESKKFLEMDNILKDDRIQELVNLCEMKDRYTLALASDDLRRGGSLGGQALVDWRYYLDEMCAA